MAADESAERLLPFMAAGNQYLAVLTTAGQRWRGVCLLVPGSGPIDADGQVGANQYLLQLASGLALRGIASIRVGKRVIGPRVGRLDDYRAEYLVPLQALVRAARQLEPRASTLALAGHSLGGHVAPYLAAHLDGIRGVALLSAHLDDLVTVMRNQLEQLPPSQSAESQQVLRLIDAVERAAAPEELESENARYLWYARHHSPRAWLPGLRVPFACLAGEQDRHVSPDQVTAWEDALRAAGLPVFARRYPGLHHLLMPSASRSLSDILESGQVSADLLDDLATWISSLD